MDQQVRLLNRVLDLHHSFTIFSDGLIFMEKKMIAEITLESIGHFISPILNIDML